MSEGGPKILWVDRDFNGPINGLAEYNGEKLWFSRLSSPTDNISDPVFSLIRLDDDLLQLVEKNHQQYCESTGAPLYHGDPFVIKKPNNGKPSSLVTVKSYIHNYNSYELSGEYITAVKSSDFTNYAIPRRVKTDL